MLGGNTHCKLLPSPPRFLPTSPSAWAGCDRVTFLIMRDISIIIIKKLDPHRALRHSCSYDIVLPANEDPLAQRFRHWNSTKRQPSSARPAPAAPTKRSSPRPCPCQPSGRRRHRHRHTPPPPAAPAAPPAPPRGAGAMATRSSASGRTTRGGAGWSLVCGKKQQGRADTPWRQPQRRAPHSSTQLHTAPHSITQLHIAPLHSAARRQPTDAYQALEPRSSCAAAERPHASVC